MENRLKDHWNAGGGLSSMGSHRVGHDRSDAAAAAAAAAAAVGTYIFFPLLTIETL